MCVSPLVLFCVVYSNSMEGVVDDVSLRGMVPQSFHYVFAGVTTNQSSATQFLVRGSFLEIYKDEVYDLLNSKVRTKMEVKESPDKGVFVKGKRKRMRERETDTQTQRERMKQNKHRA